jgi:hypothetical protein
VEENRNRRPAVNIIGLVKYITVHRSTLTFLELITSLQISIPMIVLTERNATPNLAAATNAPHRAQLPQPTIFDARASMNCIRGHPATHSRNDSPSSFAYKHSNYHPPAGYKF